MMTSGVGSSAASQLAQLAQNQRTLNDQTNQRSQQTNQRIEAAGAAVLNNQIQRQQQVAAIGDQNLKLGSILNTYA